jgi:hypothetical protein
MGRIVHQDGATEVAAQDIEVFEVIAFDGKAGLAKEAVMNALGVFVSREQLEQKTDVRKANDAMRIKSHQNKTYWDLEY